MKFYTSAREAFEALGLALPPELEPVEARFPVYLNEYYLKLIDPADWKNDPIARQALPAPAELADESSSFDPLAEERIPGAHPNGAIPRRPGTQKRDAP